jgi:heme-degrading monooxygenase HmoA
MQALRIANYEITSGRFPDLAEEAKSGMLQIFREQPGFIRYGIAQTGEARFTSLSMWETHTQAEAATPLAATWVHEHMSDKVKLQSNLVGDLAFFEGVPSTV